jgi:SAM-dependent methyltransferase
MQTCVILNGMLALTPETAESAGIRRRADARLAVAGDRLVLEPADRDRSPTEADGPRGGELAIRLSAETLETLGWRSGDVLGIELVDGHLEVRKLTDPNDPSLTALDEDGIPVPPHWLVQMVTGRTATTGFVASGHQVGRLFAELIERHLPAAGEPAVIDFGCGCGRVARVMPRYLNCELHGCDITAEAIEWCRRNLAGEFFLSADEPPLGVPDARFDVLYAVSVLTHLDQWRQDAWLAEWQRIVRPGGLLLVTYRGDGFLARAESSGRERIERLFGPSGFAFTQTDYWHGLFPEYYGGAFHRDAYVGEHWGRFFDVIELHECGDTGLVQDLAVLRREERPQAAGS